MKQLRQYFAILSTTALLTACSSDPEEKVSTYLSEGDYASAIEWLKEELQEDNTDLLLNALTTEVLIEKCIVTKCFENNPSDVQEISAFLKRIPTADAPTSEGTRPVYTNIYRLAERIIKTDQYPQGLVTLAKATSAGELRNQLTHLLFAQANIHLKNGQIPPALTLLEGVSELAESGSDYSAFAPFLSSLATDEEAAQTQSLDLLMQLSEDTDTPKETINALPYILYNKAIEEDPRSGTTNFLKNFTQDIAKWNRTPLENKATREGFASTIYNMAKDAPFMEDAQKHMAWINEEKVEKKEQEELPTESSNASIITAVSISTESSPTLESAAVTGLSPVMDEEKDIEDLSHILKLNLLRTAISLHPQNLGYWNEFITPALQHVKESDNASLLFSGVSAKVIPAEIVDRYNREIFALAEEFIESHRNIMPLISKIIIPAQKGELVREQAGAMVKNAMDKAVLNGDYDLIYAYSLHQPEIAKMSRQKIVTITIETLERKWKENEFEGMERLANFLSKKMDIDFSLDSLLLQNFDEYLKAQNLEEKLGANKANALLIKPEEARIQPDEKLIFLRKYFAKTPSVLDNVLKTYIVKAEGKYGTANALYKLYDLFDDKNFPRNERQEYLINSIKNSLNKDEDLDAIQMTEMGYNLHLAHPELPLIFVASEITKRIKNLEEARQIWNGVPEELRNSISANKPQFATLMNAVSSFENDERQAAADLFTIISDKTYLKMAQPYIKEYLDLLAENSGIYSTDETDDNMHTRFISVRPISSLDNISAENNLLDVDVTFISAIGHVLTKSPQDLSEDYSKVFTHTFRTRLDPNHMEVVLSDERRASANLPQSFDKIFGKVSALRFVNNRVIATADNKFYAFDRVEEKATGALFPQGKFGITKVIREGEDNSAQILPAGSILELKTQTSKPIQPVKAGKKLSVIYPVKGVIHNPALSEPRQVDGFYSIERHTLSLSYDYPLTEGGTVDAAIRCQIGGTHAMCAAHNKLNSRNRYTHLVTGQKIASSKSSEAMNNVKMNKTGSNFSQAKRAQYLKRKNASKERMQRALENDSAQ